MADVGPVLAGTYRPDGRVLHGARIGVATERYLCTSRGSIDWGLAGLWLEADSSGRTVRRIAIESEMRWRVRLLSRNRVWRPYVAAKVGALIKTELSPVFYLGGGAVVGVVSSRGPFVAVTTEAYKGGLGNIVTLFALRGGWSLRFGTTPRNICDSNEMGARD
jgi:hypothetical protein